MQCPLHSFTVVLIIDSLFNLLTVQLGVELGATVASWVVKSGLCPREQYVSDNDDVVNAMKIHWACI